MRAAIDSGPWRSLAQAARYDQRSLAASLAVKSRMDHRPRSNLWLCMEVQTQPAGATCSGRPSAGASGSCFESVTPSARHRFVSCKVRLTL